MHAALAFLGGLVLGVLFRPLRIDPRRRPPLLEPYRYRQPKHHPLDSPGVFRGELQRPKMRLVTGGIFCTRCGRTSYYIRDREEVYCANCRLQGELEEA